MNSNLAASNTDDLTGNVSAITGDISPDDHRKLDEGITSLSNVRFDSRNAGIILYVVIYSSIAAYSSTKWPINPAIADLMACSNLLLSNQDIRGLLQEAHRRGQYSEIRRCAEFHIRKSTITENRFKSRNVHDFSYTASRLLADQRAIEHTRLSNTELQLTLPMSSIPMSRTGSDPPIILAHWTPRIATVNSIYNRLMELRLIQVRGTPGSGKTTLMELLHAHILSQHPEAVVEIIKSWPKESGINVRERMRQRINTYPFVDPGNHYLLFDNAHGTYWDGLLWENFFKDSVQHGSGPYVILFCSHGSPLPRPVDYDNGNPLCLPQCSRVSLRPYSCSDPHHSPVGLLYSREEFDEAVKRFKDPDHNTIRLDQELRDMLFDWTMGHAGAVGDLLFKLSSLRRKKLREGGTLTAEDFFNMEPKKPFSETLGDLPNFSRGLPNSEELQDVGVAAVLRELLTEGSIMRAGDANVDICHRRGWIHSEMNSGRSCYVFSSPLHATYVSWKLIPSVIHCPFVTVRDMTFTILKKFIPSQLSSPSTIGVAFSDRPLDARYQHEFYRGLFAATGGGVRICPELFTAPGPRKGSIDFFVPDKKWGIELTQEGSNLAEHSARFGLNGKHGVWLTSNDMEDFIILDCRTSMPVLPHPHIENLFHAVFEDEFRRITILNNMLEKVEEPFALLEG